MSAAQHAVNVIFLPNNSGMAAVCPASRNDFDKCRDVLSINVARYSLNLGQWNSKNGTFRIGNDRHFGSRLD